MSKNLPVKYLLVDCIIVKCCFYVTRNFIIDKDCKIHKNEALKLVVRTNKSLTLECLIMPSLTIINFRKASPSKN